jgi:hypothetical protein
MGPESLLLRLENPTIGQCCEPYERIQDLS